MLTHKLLSKHLVLEEFDSLFKEADQNVTVLRLHHCSHFLRNELRLIKQRKREEQHMFLQVFASIFFK